MEEIFFKKGTTYLFMFKHFAFGGGIREAKCNAVNEQNDMVKMGNVWFKRTDYLETRTIVGEA